MTTDIPDDVVERAKKTIASYNCVGDCPPEVDDCTCRLAALAAGRVFVEWERERIYSLIEQYLGQEDLLDYLRSRNLPAPNPDDCNPSDYT